MHNFCNLTVPSACKRVFLAVLCKKETQKSHRLCISASTMASCWSGRRGSNSLPPPWQGGALPDELRPHTPCGVPGCCSRRRRLLYRKPGPLSTPNLHFLQFLEQKTDIRPCIVQFAISDISASRRRTSDDYSILFRFRPADAKKINLHSTPGTIIIEYVNMSYRNAAPTPCRSARVFVRGDGNVSIKEHTRCIRSLKRSR